LEIGVTGENVQQHVVVVNKVQPDQLFNMPVAVVTRLCPMVMDLLNINPAIPNAVTMIASIIRTTNTLHA